VPIDRPHRDPADLFVRPLKSIMRQLELLQVAIGRMVS